MKFFSYFNGSKLEVTKDEYVAVVHLLGFITQEGYYPGHFRSSNLEGLIEGYETYNVSWWSDLSTMSDAKLPFSYCTISESHLTARAKFAATISAESPEAASAILLHFIPSAQIARVR